jgi:S-adenosylmethionine:tRNA ribosyltransferase-isomerase
MKSGMRVEDYDYYLDKNLIAQHPLEKRDESRLLVVNRQTGKIFHNYFSQIIDFFRPGDVLVINETKVIPARIFVHRLGREEKIELLLIREIEKNVWKCLAKPGRKLSVGTEIIADDKMFGKVEDITSEGERVVSFFCKRSLISVLNEIGTMPTPPYITEKLEDSSRYQTVYSKDVGSVAAPTAGLHFTEELLEAVIRKGVSIAKLTLHVGIGTFRPVKTEVVKDHVMHSEYYSLRPEMAQLINDAKKNGGRVIAVGTTSTRTLETIADEDGQLRGQSGWTDIFIYPGYRFKVVDGLITNFHLPKSTLLMLVSAFSSREIVMNAYEEAIKHGYRFYSFGDAMFLL